MHASDVTGICLGLAGLIYMCRRNWIHRVTGTLLIVAGISQMKALQEFGMMICVLLLIPLATTVWFLQSTDKARKDTPSK